MDAISETRYCQSVLHIPGSTTLNELAGMTIRPCLWSVFKMIHFLFFNVLHYILHFTLH